MAQRKPPLSRPVLFAVIGVAALGVYTVTSSPEAPAPRATVRTAAVGGSARGQKESLYRPEDYTAKFAPVSAPVNAPAKNAFKPLIVKTKVITGQNAAIAPNGVPASFADGDANWIYTGNAEVDGVPNALLENTSTQEGIFLKPGERWKKLTLLRVTPDRITLSGPGGVERTVQVNDLRDGSEGAGAAGVAGAVGAPGTLPAATPNAAPLVGEIVPAPNRNGNGNRERRRNRRQNNGGNASNSLLIPSPSGNPS